MGGSFIDLRSDTITIPTRDMLERVPPSVLGDSLRDEDPTVNLLQDRSAGLFGKEAGLLLISGTMANQVAINAWCERGAVVIAMENSHIARKEAVSASVISGCSIYPMREVGGFLDPGRLRACLESPDDLLGGTAGLVTIENSVNAAGGTIYPLEKMEEVYAICREFGVPLHIDGSRIFNALVAGGRDPGEAGACCDSLTYCLSKGLGAPLGSVLTGPEGFIERAKESRNLMGGGMRQAGVIAACGLYALEENIDRLKDDHESARAFARILGESGHIHVLNDPVQTNIVLFSLKDASQTALLREKLDGEGVLIDYRRAPVLRAVTNLNHAREEVERAAKILSSMAARLGDGPSP
ncbi:MAG: aminotransferase class I/II-fold pyridoxal phosphate-dependent enzyme [Deltaproteobacteria bacterium]|nr:aminotransferase class I/II-fold pyridoxal phosphate-dependent enzyme [Deltaproteobacteria bacterium]NIS76780.1 aminotransferase class I/II-fold pyridoxal phosphate-dependent enzyme [Deltaproteobacteria bacterium]